MGFHLVLIQLKNTVSLFLTAPLNLDYVSLDVIAQWLARRLATREVLSSNPGKGDNFLISD